MSDAPVIPVLLGGLGGAVATFVLQTFHEAVGKRRDFVSAARVVRMELIQCIVLVENLLNLAGNFPIPGAFRSHWRREAFDRLALNVAPGLTDEFLSELVGHYSLHSITESALFETDAGINAETWLRDRWLVSALLAVEILEYATAPWYYRLIVGPWRRHSIRGRIAELNRLADEETAALK